MKQFYDRFNCAVIDGRERSDWFEIKTGVVQGCNMSELLFLVALDWVMRKTIEDGERGIRWNFTSKLDDLDFADDTALLSSTQRHIQEKTEKLLQTAKRIGLKINANKSKIVRINPKQNQPIKISNIELKDVNKLVYLGAMVSNQGGGMEDMRGRVSKARSAFTKLKKIFNSNNISKKTKRRLYKTLLTPVLMYG